ncbi:flagellar basal-body MS-ring/collar protein FliF [Roseinatronobacter alkalisoli]|uniref:Flagellar M-ring protein n=1 Tax=Roseinatronobacter alkalisoli TaxID=3028235 RepID=A0ABT5T8Q9_9RHOB|nr:flagellar basal-body MS-ring/collar protein FliF [Roseinatronobacter sp. HJB301]MDD7970756.1 flagellar basal-body MS-ring/collar protein FliF [Roseinatronobacter sp. HJB301]
MQKIQPLWAALDTSRRVMLIGAVILMFAAVMGLARLASSPGMSLLYAGLEDSAAGEVLQTLDARGIRYDVRGDAVFVPSAQRDETRLMLAAAGLPANSHSGYELLDSLSGFGTTSQMFDAAYWRAREGELARTITASPHIRSARVHISQGSSTAFRREISPGASVTVSTTSGMLNPAQARAIRYLVASAIAGMQPEGVSVIDGTGGLVYGPETEALANGTASDREADIRRRVERLLEAHVGHGRAVVELSMETVTDRETIQERLVDPDTRVAISTETEESESNSTDSRGQGVTVASNLPDGDAAGADGSAQNRESQNRQRTNFDMSETRREIERLPGAIRRLTVAVLIDGIYDTGADGTVTWRPRNAEELESLHELVASAVGYDETRGDVITLRSLPFEPVAALGTEAGSGLLSASGLDIMTLLQWVFALLALVFLAVFVLRPILRAAMQQNTGQGLDRLENTLPAGLPEDDGFPDMASPLALDFSSIGGGGGPGQHDDPVARLRQLIAERQQESVEVLRHWMDDANTPSKGT